LAEAILESVKVEESDITLADLVKDERLKEGDTLQYGDHQATVKSIDETNIALSVEKDGATSDVEIHGDTVVGIDPEGVVSVIPVAMEPEMPLMDEPMGDPMEPEGEGAPPEAMPDEPMPEPEPDFDAEEELENGDHEGMGPDAPEEEEEDELGESKDSSENVEESQEKDEQSDAGDVNDSEAPVSDVAENVREVTELKVKEASVRAERDKALEELHTLQHVKQANESHQRVRSRLMKRNEVLGAEVAGLRSVLETKAQTANESVAQLTEAKSKLDGIEKKLKSLEEDHKAEMEDKCNESFLEGKIAVLREYFDQRLRESRLKVHENVRALLGDCVTLLDVDELIERLTKAKRRDAIHSERVTEIAVRKKDREVDSEQKRVDEEVGEIFEGFGF